MTKRFFADLAEARTLTGLQQQDCAILLGIKKSQMNRTERGTRVPSVREVCTLAVIFDRPVNDLCDALLPEVVNDLRARVTSLPKGRRNGGEARRRRAAIDHLRRRLSDINPETYGG